MVTARWQPFNDLWSEMNRIRTQMDQVFGRTGDGGRLATPVLYPPVNLWEDDDRLYLEAELPGMDMNDLEIYVNGGNLLTIKGERKAPEGGQGTWHRRERGYGTFSRTVELPGLVDADKVSAEFQHGVLTVTLPKAPEAKPRRIEVRTV